MNTSATDKVFPSSSPAATSGGTSVNSPQYAIQDDKQHFLHGQSSRELVRAVSSEYSATALPKNNDHPHSDGDSFHSPSRSSSSSILQHQSSSLSLNSQHGLPESFGHMNIDPTFVPPEQSTVKLRSRVRELSAPLPSVPPSSPSSAVIHRGSFSRTQHQNPTVSPPSLHHDSPIFSSPLTEISDSEEVDQDVAELSDSNSIEIISGYVSDPFVPGRYKDVMNNSQTTSQTARPACPTAPSPTSKSAYSLENINSGIEQTAELIYSVTSATSASQTPTPHPLSHSSSSVHTIDNERKTVAGTSDNSFVSSMSRPTSPSRAQPQVEAFVDIRPSSSSETSSPLVDLVQTLENSLQSEQDAPQVKSALGTEDSLRTPNVYINGLPPHFPDESLYLMTRDFGHVLSVRTFTRCVGEKMSGYGFVLFDSVDSAERCIETLRKYRNLHPSFSKQIHKIPGTPYASGTITLPPAGSLPSLASQCSLSAMPSFPSSASTLVSSATSSSVNNYSSPMKQYGHRNDESISTASGSEFDGKDLKDLTFREKMEKLQDNRSTNLYMEGLPLTIDEVSLSALVSPHKVVSSRFFQTKLSNPPRMIAFVRLDTRVGAEEIIERLHGRVVRGWDDNGCRISVRFADTNEQRELRRAERLNRGEEEMNNGVQLSMAHAALLNLRGAEAQAQLGSVLLHQQPRLPVCDRRQPHDILPNMQSNHAIPGASDFEYIDAFHRANVVQNNSRGHNSIRQAETTPELYHHVPTGPAIRQQTRATSYNASTFAMNAYDSHVGLTSKTSMLRARLSASGPHSIDTGDFSRESVGGNRLALLQQQNQLHQLQLLRQIHSAGMEPDHFEETHSLMPSADIMMNEMNDSHLQVSPGNFPSRQASHERQATLSHIQRHAHSYNKGSNSEISAAVPIGSVNEDYIGRRRSNDQLAVRNQKHSVASPAPGYSSHFARAGADHHDGIIGASHHRRTGAIEEGELALISPALTYASRTPSTLSPATPLFNTFGTPASAPATIPRGKMNMRERDYSRLYKNEHRQ